MASRDFSPLPSFQFKNIQHFHFQDIATAKFYYRYEYYTSSMAASFRRQMYFYFKSPSILLVIFWETTQFSLVRVLRVEQNLF